MRRILRPWEFRFQLYELLGWGSSANNRVKLLFFIFWENSEQSEILRLTVSNRIDLQIKSWCAGDIGQWVKTLATKSRDPDLILCTPLGRGNNRLLQVAF